MLWVYKLIVSIRYFLLVDYLRSKRKESPNIRTRAYNVGTRIFDDCTDFFKPKYLIHYRTYIGQRMSVKSYYSHAGELLEELDNIITLMKKEERQAIEQRPLAQKEQQEIRLVDWLVDNNGYILKPSVLWERLNERLVILARLSLELKEKNSKLERYYSRRFVSTLIEIPGVIKALKLTMWEK